MTTTTSAHVVFLSEQVTQLLSLIVPLRELTFPEKIDNHFSHNALLLSTKSRSNFLFAHIDDRDFVIEKIQELLAGLTDDRR